MRIERHRIGPRFSQAVCHGDTIYLSGQIAEGRTVTQQTEGVLRKVDALLAELGSDKSKLLSATVFLNDLKDYDDMNVAWEAWIDHNNPPTRATVQGHCHNALVEIVVIASA